MSNANSTEKSSLWREGIHSYERNWRSWFRLAVIFFFITALFHMLSAYYLDPLQPQLAVLKAQKDSHAIMILFRDNAPIFAALGSLMFIVISAQKYLFLSFFMQKELPAETTQPTMRNYFCFLGKLIQLIFVIFIPMLLITLVCAGLAATKLLSSGLMGFISCILIFGTMLYLLFKFCLTTPLAAAGIKAPLKNSWVLTYGQCWRLFLNGLMLVLLFLALTLLGIIVAAIVGFIIGLGFTAISKGPFAHAMGIYVFKPIISSAIQIFVSGVVCAYISSVTRIFYREKQAADSSFKLISSS